MHINKKFFSLFFYSPNRHDAWQHCDRVPVGQFGTGKDRQREEQIEQVKRGQTDEQLVEVAFHLGAGEHKDGEDVA